MLKENSHAMQCQLMYIKKINGRTHRMNQVQSEGTEAWLVFICSGFIPIVQLKNVSPPPPLCYLSNICNLATKLE